MSLSERLNQIGESPTFKFTSKAKAMKAEGIDVIDLSVGEPDFPTPPSIKEAGEKAIKENHTKYTQIAGLPTLKDAISTRLKEDFGLDYSRDEIIISSGAKSSLFHLLQVLVNEGEEVLVPSPYWVTYPHAVTLAKGKPVFIESKEENEFRITPDQLKASITPATKAIILNNPCNPTGTAYEKHELEALIDIILEEEMYMIADEIYEKLVYDDFKFHSIASLGEDIKKKTIIINGVSKAYSMTGWRIGYAAATSDIISGMNRIQSHTTSNACTISQMASIEALTGPQYDISKMVSEFQRRRNYVYMRLQSIPETSCFKPKGAFYLYPNFSSYYGKEYKNTIIRNSYGLAYFLLKEAKVAVVPGGAFGTDEFMRISYATSMENLEKGMDRIIEALSLLKTAKKDRSIALNNVVTKFKKPVPQEPSVSLQMRDSLAAEVENHFTHDNYFEWNANINGVIIQLRTNVPHLYDFWVENWYPAQLEADLEPHGIIYAVDHLPGREPRSFYSPETKTGILVNTDLYGSLRSLALGLVMDISQRLFNVHPLRSMTVDLNGNGLALIGPKGTKKTDLFFSLLQGTSARLHSNDTVFVRLSGDSAMADSPERKLYMPTQSVESFSTLAPLFDNSKCENVVLKKDECQNETCLQMDDCRLDRGSPFCYKATKSSYAMLDPYWIGGPAKHVKRTGLKWIFILRNDKTSPPSVKVNIEDALHILESGETLGARKEIGPAGVRPFFNPHLLITSPEYMEGQRYFFRSLLEKVPCILFNSGVAGADEIMKIITETPQEQEPKTEKSSYESS